MKTYQTIKFRYLNKTIYNKMASFDLFTLFSDHLKSRGRDIYTISTSTSSSIPSSTATSSGPCSTCINSQ